MRLEGDHPIVAEIPWHGTGLPDLVAIGPLVPSATYRLEITATDGDTPPVGDAHDFLYQGETAIRFVAPAGLRPGPVRHMPVPAPVRESP
jgi:hypothetical protein